MTDGAPEQCLTESSPPSPRMTPRSSVSQTPGWLQATASPGIVDEGEIRKILTEATSMAQIRSAMTHLGDAIIQRNISDSDRSLQEAVSSIQTIFADSSLTFPSPSVSHEPVINSSMPIPACVRKIQNYIRSFEYNHVGKEYTLIEKDRPGSRVLDNAKLIIKTKLPIKCLEAVVLGAYLTRELTELLRVPLRFKTKVERNTYWHIVLALKHGNKFGAMGLSRRSTLDYRELKYDSLSDLILSYKAAYEEVGHKIKKMTVGLPMAREKTNEKVHWHFLAISVYKKVDWDAAMTTVNSYMKNILVLEESVRRTNSCKEIPGTEFQEGQLHFMPPSKNTLARPESCQGSLKMKGKAGPNGGVVDKLKRHKVCDKDGAKDRTKLGKEGFGKGANVAKKLENPKKATKSQASSRSKENEDQTENLDRSALGV